MGRIRTIKPEFPQSESMGRVCREARLCFILLFTLADDSGRLRGNSRMLASLLYPYDDDAKKHIDGWLKELHKEECITRYEAEGDQYIQLNKWLQHQKIDKPSPSKIPPPNENSRGFANAREDSVADQGRDQGMEGIKEGSSSPKGSRIKQDWVLPTDYRDFCRQERPDLDPDKTADVFRDHWISKAGKDGAKLDWFATWRNWVRNQHGAKKPSLNAGGRNREVMSGLTRGLIGGASNVKLLG